MLTNDLLEYWQKVLSDLGVWIVGHVLTIDMFAQILLGALVVILAVMFAKRLGDHFNKIPMQGMFWDWVRRVAPSLLAPLFSLISVLLVLFIGRAAGLPVGLFEIAASLLTAWIFIRLLTSSLLNRGVARFVGIVVWGIAAMDILNVLEPVTNAMKTATVTVGASTVSAYDVIWGLMSFAILIWLALLLSRMVDRQLQSMRVLAPSVRVLLGKVVRIFLVATAFMIALNSTGIDLTVLAVFGGALGVGLGFGLQKVVSNFVSGLILLLDRSIKPGDVIEIQGTYGQINNLAARYTSVVTRDGTEFLIPNEDMITQSVVNWSHSNKLVRRRVALAVDYDTDLRKAMELMNEAAGGKTRVVSNPPPRTLLRNFGDNGVELELRFWITDPENGVSNITSDVMMDIWDKFHEHGINFPFPQLVIHKAEDWTPNKS